MAEAPEEKWAASNESFASSAGKNPVENEWVQKSDVLFLPSTLGRDLSEA